MQDLPYHHYQQLLLQPPHRPSIQHMGHHLLQVIQSGIFHSVKELWLPVCQRNRSNPKWKDAWRATVLRSNTGELKSPWLSISHHPTTPLMTYTGFSDWENQEGRHHPQKDQGSPVDLCTRDSLAPRHGPENWQSVAPHHNWSPPPTLSTSLPSLWHSNVTYPAYIDIADKGL